VPQQRECISVIVNTTLRNQWLQGFSNTSAAYMFAFKARVLCIAAKLFFQLTKEPKCYIAQCSAAESKAKSWRRMLVSPFSLPKVCAQGHSLFNSLPLYFSDLTLENEVPKLGPSCSVCHQSHQALPE